MIAQVVTSILAAYAFVFLRFPLRRTLFFVVLATVMIPFEITVSVNYITVQNLGWDGNFLGLTVPFLATGFGIFLLRQAFLQIPKELQEAAVIDGYGPIAFLWRIAIPLARPVIAALAVFSLPRRVEPVPVARAALQQQPEHPHRADRARGHRRQQRDGGDRARRRGDLARPRS